MNRTLLFAFLLLLPMQLGLQKTPDNTGKCDLYAKGICSHVFASTDSTTTADSDPYEVDKCDALTYKFDGDGGTASLFVKECSTLSSGACVSGDTSVFTADTDGDGLITSIDEVTTLNGNVGRRGYKMLAPGAKWHFIDVQAVPGSGSVHVTVQCHNL